MDKRESRHHLAIREAFKGGLDVEIKEVEEGSHSSLHIPPSLCGVILACSIQAPLAASALSKGRGISSGGVPSLCLILFYTFVVA